MKFIKKASGEKTERSASDIEKALIIRIAQKHDDALESLYRLYFGRLYRFAFRITGSLDYVEEIINDVMLVVWNKAETYNHCCRPSTWILGIAYNKARKYSTRPKFDMNTTEIDERDGDDYGPSNPDWVKRIELQDQLENALAILSVEQRLVVELTYYHGMHYSEIAQIAGCAENTVKTRMFHARKKLARVLQD